MFYEAGGGSNSQTKQTQMQQFIGKFNRPYHILKRLGKLDQAYNKLKRHGITICNDVLGFKLLKAANLLHRHEQLMKAVITGGKL